MSLHASVFAFCLVIPGAFASQGVDNSAQDPFARIDWLPADIDAAVILNNPARLFTVFLDTDQQSPQTTTHSQQAHRQQGLTVLAHQLGLLRETTQAVNAIAATFQRSRNEIISDLLSQQVLIVWENEFEPREESALSTQADGESDVQPLSHPMQAWFDLVQGTNRDWAIICELHPGYQDQIRQHLKPIRRRLVGGETIYAIEKGRYEIAFLNHSVTQGDTEFSKRPMLVISPRDASSILGSILKATSRASSGTSYSTLVSKHRAALDELAETIPPAENWACAVLVPSFIEDQNQQDESFAGVIYHNESELSLHVVASNSHPNHAENRPQRAAPMSLLGAMDDRVLAAVAVSQTPGFAIDAQSVSLAYSNTDLSRPSFIDEFASGPAMLIVRELEEQFANIDRNQNARKTSSLSMFTYTEVNPLAESSQNLATTESDPSHPSQDDMALICRQTDQVVQRLLIEFGDEHAPDYLGRFPSAIRTHQLSLAMSRNPDQQLVGNEQQPVSWPGDYPKVSWLTTRYNDCNSVISAMTPQWTDPADQLRWLHEAMGVLDSIPDRVDPAGIYSAGFMKLRALVEQFETESQVDLMLSSFIDRLDWRITHSSVGYHGHIVIEMSDTPNDHSLGN